SGMPASCWNGLEAAHAVGGYFPKMKMKRQRSKSRSILAAATLLLPGIGQGVAQQPKTLAAPSSTAAADIADFFSQVGNGIYEHCIFELSEEQLEVQHALIDAYIKQGATSAVARQLAIKQIQPPELSEECKQIKNQGKLPPAPPAPTPWSVTTRKTEVSLPKVSAKDFTPSVPLTD